jgi:RNA polymerase sigma-70 factor (ECF subfamily)
MTRQTLFRGWLSTHRAIVVRISRSFARSPSEAADLEQEILLQLWIALPNFAGESKVSTFIYRVCLNTALAWRRGASRREDRTVDGVDFALLPAEAEEAGDRLLLQHLYAAIHQLPQADRALILLHLEGLSYREIADVAGMTENHVGVALTRARKRLSTLMKGVIDEVD